MPKIKSKKQRQQRRNQDRNEPAEDGQLPYSSASGQPAQYQSRRNVSDSHSWQNRGRDRDQEGGKSWEQEEASQSEMMNNRWSELGHSQSSTSRDQSGYGYQKRYSTGGDYGYHQGSSRNGSYSDNHQFNYPQNWSSAPGNHNQGYYQTPNPSAHYSQSSSSHQDRSWRTNFRSLSSSPYAYPPQPQPQQSRNFQASSSISSQRYDGNYDPTSGGLPPKDRSSKKGKGQRKGRSNDDQHPQNSNTGFNSLPYHPYRNSSGSSNFNSTYNSYSNYPDQNPSASFNNQTSSFNNSGSNPIPSASRSRTYKSPSPIALTPRSSYLSEVSNPSTLIPPKACSTSSTTISELEPNSSMPLLILDLNGTLLHRKKASKQVQGGKDSSRPDSRPFLKSFLRYCLGDGEVEGSDLSGKGKGKSKMGEEVGYPHGSHFWSDKRKKNEGFEVESDNENGKLKTDEEREVADGKIRQRWNVLIWSSAQPQNVDSMVRALLPDPYNNSQDQTLEENVELSEEDIPQGQDREVNCSHQGPTTSSFLRVYARDTLIRQAKFSTKCQSIKDLEIVWKALNTGDESEVLAEDRWLKENSSETNQDQEMKEDLSNSKFGSHNTILLDDSIDKTGMQPFNHLFLEEYDGMMAGRTKEFQRFLRTKLGGGEIEVEEVQVEDEKEVNRREESGIFQYRIDTALLQVIGVLEHARWQSNVGN